MVKGTQKDFQIDFDDHHLLRQMVDDAPFLSFVRDLDGRFPLVNKLYEQILGKSREEIIGKHPSEIFNNKEAESLVRHDQAVLAAKRSMKFEERTVVDGVEKFWLASKSPLYNSEGEIVAIAGMSAEITQRKRAERELQELNRSLESANIELRSTQEQLIQAEKMESVGRLAAGVAHEVKNPLALILMGVEYLSQLPPETDPNFAEILDEMRKAVRRAEKIIHGLVDFSASRQLEFQEVDVNRVVQDTLPFIKHDCLRMNVQLLTELAPKLPLVNLDVQKFEQVLLNLLINSLQAVGKNGNSIHLVTRSGVLTAGEPLESGSRSAERLREGDSVVQVIVKDEGSGISPVDLEKIFDPFFTTKATGEGTGLGLSICRKIIELHGGRITARSEMGVGTTVTITLKACEGAGIQKNMRDKPGQILIESI